MALDYGAAWRIAGLGHAADTRTQDKFSNYAIYFELAVLTHSHVFVMTRGYRKTFLTVRVCNIQWFSVRGLRSVAATAWAACRANAGRHAFARH